MTSPEPGDVTLPALQCPFPRLFSHPSSGQDTAPHPTPPPPAEPRRRKASAPRSQAGTGTGTRHLPLPAWLAPETRWPQAPTGRRCPDQGPRIAQPSPSGQGADSRGAGVSALSTGGRIWPLSLRGTKVGGHPFPLPCGQGPGPSSCPILAAMKNPRLPKRGQAAGREGGRALAYGPQVGPKRVRGGAADQVPGSLRLPFPHSVARTPPQAPALTPLPQTCRHPGGPKVTAQGRATATAQEPGPSRRRHRHLVNKHHRGASTPRPPWRPTPVSGPGARGGRQVPAVPSSAASLGAGSRALRPQDRPRQGGDPRGKLGAEAGLGTERPYPEPVSARGTGGAGAAVLSSGRRPPIGARAQCAAPAARQCGSRARGRAGRGAGTREEDAGGSATKAPRPDAPGGSSGAGEGAGESWGQGEGDGREGGPEMESGARGEAQPETEDGGRGGGQARAHPEREVGREPAERYFEHKRGSLGVRPAGTGWQGCWAESRAGLGAGDSLRWGSRARGGPPACLVPVLRHLQDAAQGEPACLQFPWPTCLPHRLTTQAPKPGSSLPGPMVRLGAPASRAPQPGLRFLSRSAQTTLPSGPWRGPFPPGPLSVETLKVYPQSTAPQYLKGLSWCLRVHGAPQGRRIADAVICSRSPRLWPLSLSRSRSWWG